MSKDNVMRKIQIEKITLNMGLGTKLESEHARTILSRITKAKPITIRTEKRSTFGIPRGKEIGCKVTVRKNTTELLKRLLDAKDNRIKKSNFDKTGNLSFGIAEYIDIPGTEYDPKIGIIGMDVCVTLGRPSYSVKRKKLSSRIGRKHRITKEEAINFIRENFGVEIR